MNMQMRLPIKLLGVYEPTTTASSLLYGLDLHWPGALPRSDDMTFRETGITGSPPMYRFTRHLQQLCCPDRM